MTDKLQTAIDFFKELHKDQKRRDGVRPYFVHLEDVARRVAQLTDDEDIIIAAFGHDSLEDCAATPPVEYGNLIIKISELFGLRVVGFIVELTDNFAKKDHPTLNRKTRKALERQRYSTMSSEARLIKCCDIASNLSDLDDSDRGFSIMFVKEKALCLPYLCDLEFESRELIAAWNSANDILQAQKVKFGVR